jgi:ATP-dependent helicase/nuclease subunit B
MHVFSVPASEPFLACVITALVDGRLVAGFEARRDPARLAEVTLYLPTRRAGRLAREVFLDVLGRDGAVLPRIRPLGDIDEDDLAFDEAAAGGAALDLPDELGGLQRRLVLARLIGAWTRSLAPRPGETPLVIGGPAAALQLADDLARLMDDMTTRQVPWEALATLVPEQLDVYWQQTLRFLKIAAEAWPAILAEQQKIEPAQRRDLLIAAEARRLAARHPGPIIAAGSTGSMPATAKFLDVVARLPNGAVVLPGLDTDLDDAAWQMIGGRSRSAPSAARKDDELTPPVPGHPQYALHHLLARFGIGRDEVRVLAPPRPHGREILASEALRPASATGLWQRRLGEPAIDAAISAAMASVSVVAAPSAEMEALAIAAAMREAHETPERTVALVTPDRALARRVMASLARWGLAFDDSGGDSLSDTAAGRFARLCAAVVSEQLAPAALLALLKHPLFHLGRRAGSFARAIEDLEEELLRGPRLSPGSATLVRQVAGLRADPSRPDAVPITSRRRLSPERAEAVADLVARLATALAPLERIGGKPQDLVTLAAAHREVIVALSVDAEGECHGFAGTDGLSLAQAFDEVLGGGASGLMLTLADYPDVFQATIADRIVRRPVTADARLRIFGPLEARLTVSDRVILGGLVEGVWPPEPRIDPWLNRPMRHQLGLDLPERRIGLSAHDFAQLLGAPEVILTHAAKVGGAPAVASRFLHRLEAVAGEARYAAARARGARYLACAEALDRPAVVEPARQPMPTPPRHARPLSLSVTQIEDWLRDPYTIYARHILNLRPLDPVDMPLSVADRGSAIHAAIGEFTERFRDGLPADPVAALRAIGARHFAELMEQPEARALWWPRFLRIAGWLAQWERERRPQVAEIAAELPGEIGIALPHGRQFRLRGRADRIERRPDGRYAILDYKTGAPPTGKQVRMGLSPQLTLEAAMLREGGFAGIPAGGSVAELTYVRLSGNNPPGLECRLELARDRSETPQSPDEAASEARAKLEALVRRFDDENQPYKSLVLTMWSTRYGDYDALARVKEWAGAGDDGEPRP